MSEEYIQKQKQKQSVARTRNIGIIVVLVLVAVGVARLVPEYRKPERGGENPVNQAVQEVVDGATEPDHEEREKVRAWLKENTNSGTWEEVRWWRFKSDEGVRITRLKYRTQSALGGKVLQDEVFLIKKDGRAKPSSDDYRIYGNHGFTDDAE